MVLPAGGGGTGQNHREGAPRPQHLPAVALPSTCSVPDSRSDAVTQSPAQETRVSCNHHAILCWAAQDVFPSVAAGSGHRTTPGGTAGHCSGLEPLAVLFKPEKMFLMPTRENKRLRTVKNSSKPRGNKECLTHRLFIASLETTVMGRVFLAPKKK